MTDYTIMDMDVSIPVAELLEEAGIPANHICEKLLAKSSLILEQSTSKAEKIPHHLLVINLQMLAHSLVQSSSKPEVEEQEGLYQRTIEKVIKPYIQVLSAESHQCQEVLHCKAAVQDLLVSLIACGGSSQQHAVEYFSSILDAISAYLSAPDETEQLNPHFMLQFFSEILQKVSAEGDNIDLSNMFEKVLDLLKLSDSKMCFVLACTIIPHFITSGHLERADMVWSMIESVYLGRINIEHDRLDFVITLLCCFRDIFIHYDKSSPFSSLFSSSVTSLAPVVDIRGNSSFWEIIQDGLISSDPFSRKRCMYLLHCVLVSVQSLQNGQICSESGKFWWAKEQSRRLKNVWDDLVLVLETMEEKQIHIVKPVKKHLSNVLDASRQQINGCYVLHISWVHVALSRVFDHYEAKSIIQWGVVECLCMELANSPLLHADNWGFIFGKLLQVLGQTFLYNRAPGQSQDYCPPVAKNLIAFLHSFILELPKEEKGVFLAKFLSSCAEHKLAEVPLAYISYAVSELPTGRLAGRCCLAAVRSIVLSSILTHKPSLRAGSQIFLLKAVCNLTDDEEVGFLEVLQVLGSFREAECLVFGSQPWRKASMFLLSFSSAKGRGTGCGSELTERENGLFSYLMSCVQAYLTGKSSCGDPLPTIPTLARAVLLALDGECTTDGTRVFSTETLSLEESLTLLVTPIMDTITTATARVYLEADIVSNAVEFLSSLLHLLPAARLAESGAVQALYSCLSPWLPDTVRFLHSELLHKSKAASRTPELSPTLFNVNTLKRLYNLMWAFEFPFGKYPDVGVTSLSQRAADMLTSLGPGQRVVELSSSFLGSITALGWLSTCPSQPHSDTPLCSHPHSLTAPLTLPLTLSAVITSLPLPLILCKVSDDDDKSDQVVGMCVASRRKVEWGPLVCHCLNSYWNCLLHLMKHEDEWVLKRGVESMIQMCLDSLDSASECLPIVIQCLSLLVNKSPEGPSHVGLFSERLWSFVIELRDKPRLFSVVMESFVQLLFHSNLLLNTSSDLSELQEEYAQKIFILGESKTGVCNILVDQAVSVWREALKRVQCDPSADDRTAKKRELLASVCAHKQLLIQGCTFGTVHRKNLRIVADTEEFIESVGVSTTQDQYSRSDCNIRVKLLVFLLEMFGTLSQEADESLNDNFLHGFVLSITAEILEMSGYTPKYYVNSHTHRVKLRLLQLLILSLQYVNKVTCKLVSERMVAALQYDNQRSVRYLMEWIVVLVLARFPDLVACVLHPCLDMETESRLSRMCSFFTIAMHLGLGVKSILNKADYYREIIPMVLKWTSSHHFTTRLYSQSALRRMWIDCQSSQVKEIVEKFQVLDECIRSMQVHGDCGKSSHKLEENIFFSLVDSVNDISIQTIFHTLPLLCDAPREDLISTESFVREVQNTEMLFFELSCKNKRLLETADRVLTSTTAAECGSDTKSIAYQLRPKDGLTEVETSLPSMDAQSSDIQKKITPWSNPKTIMTELFPDSLSSNMSGLQEKAVDNQLILVTTLLSKIPNIGGLCRTSEIFGVSEIVIDNAKIVGDVHFQSLSVTAEKWIRITEVKLNALKDYLLTMHDKGYTLVGAEQTAQSKCLTDYSFKNKTVFILGNEREGIPVDLIHLLDDCVEIPQLGVVRSLNVHVSGALMVWEYAKQHFFQSKN